MGRGGAQIQYVSGYSESGAAFRHQNLNPVIEQLVDLKVVDVISQLCSRAVAAGTGEEMLCL
jgi:hypothetical protein